ncbi:MAG: GTPase HflX, partial [Pseudomonadota bacterium]
MGTADRDGLKLGAPAAVVVPVLPSALERGASASERRAEFESFRSGDAKQDEALGLAGAIDLDVRHCDVINVRAPRPSHLFGKGQLATVREAVAEHDLEVVVVDYPLTPIQQRNLERDWQAKVLDRTGLILEIFGRRAQTKEGRLQVELAHLTFQKSRLVRSWTHLERQRGGTGFLGGPGETQMEADRRIIQTRIDGIKRDLERVQNMRTLHRKGRKRAPSPVVALVGYTNAGKSTLFNQLTGSDIFAKDLLFATLDPTMRELFITPARKIILSDTVGFISELPTSLIAAFRATLEEVLEADVILHVRDIAHADSGAQRADVLNVLAELGVARPGQEQAPAIDGGPGTDPAPVSAERFIHTSMVG